MMYVGRLVLGCILRNYLLMASLGLLALSAPPSMGLAATPSNRTVSTDISAKDSISTLDLKVIVITDKSHYFPGERINVIIHNDSPVPVFVPGMTDACSVVVIERQASSTWISEGACIPVGTIQRIEIEPDQRLNGFLSPEGKTFWVLSHASAVSVSIPPAGNWPYQPSTSLRSYATPVLPASPTTTVPEGERPPGPPHPLFHSLTAELGPGTYRVSVSYSDHGPEDLIQTIYSAPFIVKGEDTVPAHE